MRALAIAILAVRFLAAQPIYDLLLKNGHVIDVKNQRDGRMDVAVSGTKIARVAENIQASQAKAVIDLGRYFVTPGMIDLQAHVNFYPEIGRGVQPDLNSLRNGVTTVVDAGSAGVTTFEDFKRAVIDRSQVRVLAFLNTHATKGKEGAEPEAVAQLVRQFSNWVVGVEADLTGEATIADFDRVIRTAELSKTIAVFSPRSSKPVSGELLARMRPGDILTHIYGPDRKDLSAGLLQARRRGVLFDLGHGSQGFSFQTAASAIKQGFLPDTISSDMDAPSLLLQRAEMATTLSKLLNLGIKLEMLVERATVNPARAIRRPELGSLSEGSAADIAVFAREKGKFGFLDSLNLKLAGGERLRCALTVRNGRLVWDEDGLSLADWTTVGPYTLFK